MIEPEGTKVVVEPERLDERPAGKIIIPEQVRDRQQMGGTIGKVYAIGPAAAHEFSDDEDDPHRLLKVGDRVVFPSYGGIPLKTTENPPRFFRILAHDDIIARVGEEIEEGKEMR